VPLGTVTDDIRQARHAAGITRAALAARSGVSERTIATLESGGRVSEKSRTSLVAALSSYGGRSDAEKASGAPPPKPRRDDARVTLPDFKVFRDLPIIGMPAWDTVQAVRAAILQMDNTGQFFNAALLMDAMLQDDRVVGTLSARFDGLLGLPMEMRPPAGMEENARAVEIAQAAQRDFPLMADEATLRSLLKWGRGLGVGLAEKRWQTGGERWIPRLKVWHPRFLYWRWDSRLFHIVTEGDGAIDVRQGPDVPENERDPHWLLYTPFGYGRDAWVNALIRSLAIPWLIRQWAYRDWARYSEVHGLPIRKVKMPAEWSDEERQRALEEIGQLASESVVRCIQRADGTGFDLTLEEAKANTWEGFQKLIDKTDASIAVAVVGQNLTTEVKGGSLAAAQVHERVRDDIIRSDAETLGSALREGLLRDWCAYNFGDPDLAPWPHWHVEQPEDKQAAATGFVSVGKAIKELRGAGVPLDAAALCDRFDVPVQEGEPFEEPKPPEPEEPEDGDDHHGKATMRAELRAHRLPKGAIEGQGYADDLIDEARAKATAALEPDLRALLAIVEKADDYHGIRRALIEHYKGMKPAKLADLMERCLILAEMNGRLSVVEDTGGAK
jgi:phage gp29-like protein/DNA-binding XRE family transcriptional regulator